MVAQEYIINSTVRVKKLLTVHYEYVINDFRLYNFLTRTVLLIVYSWTTAQKRGNQRTLITYPENLLPEI